MKRALLAVLLISSLFSLAYFGYELLHQNELTYSPKYIFNKEDQRVLRINRLDEFLKSDEAKKINNPLVRELQNFNQEELYNIQLYISCNRPVLIFDKKEGWKKEDAKQYAAKIKLANTKSLYNGRYLLIHSEEQTIIPKEKDFDFLDGDIKASYNIWNYDKEWIKTDVYNVRKGYFEYRTASSQSNVGIAIADVEYFTSVLPENIASYTFKSRFYAELNDSIYKHSPLSKWVNQGFVLADFEDQLFMVTDNRSKQTPALLLLEASDSDDENDYTSEIKTFNNIKLTNDFPVGNQIYVLEIEDKTIITEEKDLAEKIRVIYNLGETLSLNESKKEQFFKGLPTNTHYRMVNEGEKRSKTWSGKIMFEVATLPPGENLIMTETKNWTYNPKLDKVNFIVPIKDHIRGGASLFITDNGGNYEIISQSGNSLFKGKVEDEIVDPPIVIDLFENDKKQLLFRTQKKVYVLALNGELVSNFPYESDHKITTTINPFRWSNAFRCIFGNEKGEIIMLNQKGGELNIVQASSSPLAQSIYALNIGGNLRSWFIDDNNNTGLAYLETPAQTEGLFKNSAKVHTKKGSEVVSFIEHEGEIITMTSSDANTKPFAKGVIINISSDYIAVKNGNQVSFYDFLGTLLSSQKIGFNEVGSAHRFLKRNVEYTGVYDYLENNYYLYNNLGVMVDGFPKEARKRVELYLDPENNLINIFTIINGNIICYKEQIVD